jgi:hypothetical protein
LHQRTARQLILSAAAVYLVLVGTIELGRRLGVVGTFTANDAVRAVTTLASLAVGSVLGFYLASRQRES